MMLFLWQNIHPCCAGAPGADGEEGLRVWETEVRLSKIYRFKDIISSFNNNDNNNLYCTCQGFFFWFIVKSQNIYYS